MTGETVAFSKVFGLTGTLKCTDVAFNIPCALIVLSLDSLCTRTTLNPLIKEAKSASISSVKSI